MVSQKVIALCQSSVTVSSELARNPSLVPGSVAKKLYVEDNANHTRNHIQNQRLRELDASAEDLRKAYECGKWGTSKPSELFLKVIIF